MGNDGGARGDAGTPVSQAAVAIFCGSALAASGAVSPSVARALLSGIVLAGLVLARRSPARRSGARAFLLAFLILAASLRAGAGSDSNPPVAEGMAIGRWRPTGGSRDRDQGSLDGEAPRLGLVRGTVAPGEAVAVLAGEEAPQFARGPEPGPSRSGGLTGASSEPAPDEVVRIAGPESGAGARAAAAFERIRGRLLERAAGLTDPLTRGLVSGLLFGDLTELPRGVGDLFVRTGTFHILAISGLQVALVAILLVGPVAKVLGLLLRAASRGRLRDGSQALRAVLLLLFVPIAGAGPPVLRSALTWVLGSLAPSLRAGKPFAVSAEADPRRRERFMTRASHPLSIWSLALLFECLLHPDAPMSLSVQLTYAATFGLIVASGPIRRLLVAAWPNRAQFSATSATGRARPELARILAQKACDTSVRAVSASLAAVLATIAFVWARFGEWSPAGILATPAIAIPVAWILVGGWAWLVAPGLVPQSMLDLPCRWMIGLLETFDRFPDTPCELPPRPFWLLLLASGLTLLALAWSRGRLELGSIRRDRIWRAAALVWVSVLLPWVKAPASLEVHALDVGHGTAAVLRGPGGAVWVFDAGSKDRPEVDREALAPLLRTWDASRLAVVLSHPDRDHDGALGWLADRYPPRLWAGALPAQIDARLPHTTLRVDVRDGRMMLPDIDPAGAAPGLELSRGLDVDGNEGSRTLEITWGGDRIVLCGDAESEGLSAWLSARPRRGPVRLLLFPHHGSETSLIAPLLAALQPEEVWISTSGVPAVARELHRRRIRCRLTSVEGPLILDLH